MKTITATPTNFWGRLQRWYALFKENIGEDAPTQGENYCPVFWIAVLTYLAEAGFLTKIRLIRVGHLVIIALYLLVGMPTYSFGMDVPFWLTGVFMLIWSMASVYVYDWLINNDFLDVFVNEDTTLETVYPRAMLILLFTAPIVGFIAFVIAIFACIVFGIGKVLEKAKVPHIDGIVSFLLWTPCIWFTLQLIIRIAQSEMTAQEAAEVTLVVGGSVLALILVVLGIMLLIKFFLFLNRKTGIGAGVKKYALKWYKENCPKWRFVAK